MPGSTEWQNFASPFLSKALKKASSAFKKKKGKSKNGPSKKKIAALRSKRAKINLQIKKELGK